MRSQANYQTCTGSVSKLLAPALRVGWMVVPTRYQQSMVAAKRDIDLGNAVLPQLVLAQLMSPEILSATCGWCGDGTGVGATP